jgi:Tfp pilus assembly protein PilP
VQAKSSRGPVAPFRRLWPLAAALAVGLSACSGSEAPAPPPPPRPAAAPVSKAPPPAPAAAPAPAPVPAAMAVAFTYEAKGRRDPFRPLIAAKPPMPPRKCPPTGCVGLPWLRVAELKLTGIIWGGRGYYALVEAPDGKGYVIRKNDLVGEDADESARVSAIVPDAVTFEVQGIVQTPSARTRVVELRLRKEE